jgi:hypothetical protein
MKPRPVKGDHVLDDSNQRWKVIAVDVDDEGIFVERSRSIRFLPWAQFEKYWRIDEESK